MNAHPPKAQIAFRVGVVGHRPDRLPSDPAALAAVRARIAEVLDAVAGSVMRYAEGPGAACYSQDAAPILRANSPLAEGADRFFAEEALRLGYHLTCVMPFAQGEFERDFHAPDSIEDASLERFRQILAEAETVGALTRFELDGRRARAREAYEAAGRVVLNQSDLLVVVWDGGASAGVGGTVDTLRTAIEFNVPALWIDSRPPNGVRLLRSLDEVDRLDSDAPEPTLPPAPGFLEALVDQVVVAELDIPGGDEAPETRSHLKDYLAERRPAFNFAFVWKLFRDFLDVGAIRVPKLRVEDFETQIRAAWPVSGDPGPAPAEATSWINSRLRGHYAWSDKLADLYADAHRSSFVWSSLLAATAVFTALVPVTGHFGPRAALATAAVEALVLAFLVGLPTMGRRGRWHQKWMEYRVLAELVRELRILIPLGGARPLPRTSAHLASYGDPTRSWMYWQVRAIARQIGLPEARVDDDYVAGQIADLMEFVGGNEGGAGQLGFHRLNCERMERIHHRLHRMALILFGVTIAAVGVNWAQRLVFPEAPARLTEWLILFSACLPAFGAALASINNQGEFARLQRRSRAMAASLETMRERIGALSGHPNATALSEITAIAAQIAAMMVDENTEWRIVVQDLPHVAG